MPLFSVFQIKYQCKDLGNWRTHFTQQLGLASCLKVRATISSNFILHVLINLSELLHVPFSAGQKLSLTGPVINSSYELLQGEKVHYLSRMFKEKE